MSGSNLRGPFYPGEKRFVRIGIPDQLEDGAEIVSVTWTPESPVTLVMGSSVIYSRGRGTNNSVKALFDLASAVAGERYSISAMMVTSEDEEIEETVIMQVKARPV